MTFGNRKFAGFLGAATVVIVAEYVLVLSDCVIAGRVLGETALGAMNLLMPVFSTVSFFTWLLAVGTSIVYSDAIARMDRERAARLAGQGLAAAVALGLALVGVTLALESPYLAFMAPDEATMRFSGGYWDWYPAVVMLEALDLVLLYLVYTDGGETACVFSYCGQVVVNIALSYALCSGIGPFPRLGMAGISLGTVFAYLTGIAALLPRLLGASSGLRFRPAFLPRELLRSLKASFGDASAGLFHALLFFVITKYVIRCWGPETLPITAVVFCIVRLTVFFNGIGIALQPLETVYHGEGNETGVSRLVRFATAVSFAEGLAISAVLFIAPELVISLVGIEDPDLVVAAKRAARLTVTGLSGYAIAYMLNSHYQYVGRPDRSVALTALAFFAVPVALVLALGAVIGMDGVWIAVAAGPACALASFLPLLRREPPKANPTLMWSFRLARLGKRIAVVRAVGEELERTADAATAMRVTDVLMLALKHLAAANRGRRGTVRVEVALKRDPGLVTLIVRDDGELHALDGLGVPVRHVPTTGFNRNVFTFAAAEHPNPQVPGTDAGAA